MRRALDIRPIDALRVAACLLILRVICGVVAVYPAYFPPDYTAEFLRGRRIDFAGSYPWAFYPHILVGPLTLVLGMGLLSDRWRRRCPSVHAKLGRIQILLVLLGVAPSGLWRAFFSRTGTIGQAGFAMLAVATAYATWQGWRSAVGRRFREHGVWMRRSYLLLCSAVVIRVIGGAQFVSGYDAEWIDPTAAWLSWLLPLTGYEWLRRTRLKP